jgi:hypothetical protein
MIAIQYLPNRLPPQFLSKLSCLIILAGNNLFPAINNFSTIATYIPTEAFPQGMQGEFGAAPSDQRDKEAFLSNRSSGSTEWTLPHSRTQGAPFELKTGVVIPGIMLSGINSDLPGQLIGQVSQNVYDTARTVSADSAR